MSGMTHPVTPFYAIILGAVEGLTEYLPVSSTGHLILTSRLLGLDNPQLSDAAREGVKAYEVVIQSGALLAVIGLYMGHIRRMLRGLMGSDAAGLQLLIQLLIAFLPAGILGFIAGHQIKAWLFGDGPFGYWPVIIALGLGGAIMLGVESWRNRRVAQRGVADGLLQADLETPGSRFGRYTLEQMTVPAALIIGLAQCFALWPGVSRSMTTIVAALLLGFSPVAAAEFSFLLALPTLGGATAYDMTKSHEAVLLASGPLGLATGFLVSFIVAWLAVKGFVHFLNRRGLAPFGYYRIALAGLAAFVLH
jgi:undecaprenyl-diphosphatase